MVLPASTASNSRTPDLANGDPRQRMAPRSASHQHVVVRLSGPEHGNGWRRQMREGVDVRPHRWQPRGNSDEEAHRCLLGTASLVVRQNWRGQPQQTQCGGSDWEDDRASSEPAPGCKLRRPERLQGHEGKHS